MRRRDVLLGALLLLSIGCVGPRATIGVSGLISEVAHLRTRSAQFDVLWYQGRREGYDHFLYEFGMYGKRAYRVREGEAPLARWFVYSSANFDWVRVDTTELMNGRFVVQEWRGNQR